jgi:predicted hydrocarbon binding protein
MGIKGGTPREIAVPVSIFGSLRAELEKEAGTLPTVHALHHAGYAAGVAAAGSFTGNGEGDPASLGEDAFWSRLSEFFSRRGWGKIQHERPHRAVGILSSTDWAEAADPQGGPEASCHFSTGFLSGILSQLAGGPVAVLEVECRMRGAGACRFAFGSEGAVHELYGRLLDDVDLDGALAAL